MGPPPVVGRRDISAGRWAVGTLRRRGWVLLVSAVLGGVIASALTAARPETHTAEAVLVVPSGAGEGDPGRASDATRLAATYAQVLENDARVLGAAAEELSLPVEEVKEALSVDAIPDTSLLRVQ